MPKSDAQPVQRAIVWVDDRDGAVRQLQLTDANGLVRTLA
jgi:outer membrane lipoprotein-sorting protein